MELLKVTIGYFFFFFNDTATTEIYTLSLHDALPILYQLGEAHPLFASLGARQAAQRLADREVPVRPVGIHAHQDRKSTRLNSSHSQISDAVLCLEQKIYTRGRALYKSVTVQLEYTLL